MIFSLLLIVGYKEPVLRQHSSIVLGIARLVINSVKKTILPGSHVAFIGKPSSAYDSQEIITNRLKICYIVVFKGFNAP